MNERGVAVLMQAALEGREQVKGAYYSGDGGCAVGVLHQALFGHTRLNYCCPISPTVGKEYQMSHEEILAIIRANDVLGWDFLTIARKFETSPDAAFL